MLLKKSKKAELSQEEFDEFIERYNEVISEISKFCFYTRAIEFQKSALNTLDELSKECEEFKVLAINNEDEDKANALLSLEILINVIQSELKMWIELKEDRPDKAWNFLIQAQYSLASAIRVHPILNNSISLMNKYALLENIIFPPQQFLSSGGILRESKCSICGEDYEECEHIKGKPYMGKMCVQEILKIDMQEVSVVDEPADKRCRIYSFSDEGGMRDILTWRIVEKSK